MKMWNWLKLLFQTPKTFKNIEKQMRELNQSLDDLLAETTLNNHEREKE